MNLVIQGSALRQADADSLAAELKPKSIVRKSESAFVLADPAIRKSLDAWSEAHKADHAWLEKPRRFADLKLLAMDMDSTLITIECIDEIADRVGIKSEVAAITASAMRGEIDFAASLTRRVALLAGLPVTELERVYDERVALSPGAERMLEGFRAAGARTLLVSGGFTFFTDRLAARLGFDETAANTLEIDAGRLTGRVIPPIVDGHVKAKRLSEMRNRITDPDGIALAIGDGANDVPMLKVADVSIAYHAKPIVRAQATYAIDRCGLDGVLNLFR